MILRSWLLFQIICFHYSLYHYCRHIIDSIYPHLEIRGLMCMHCLAAVVLIVIKPTLTIPMHYFWNYCLQVNTRDKEFGNPNTRVNEINKDLIEQSKLTFFTVLHKHGICWMAAKRCYSPLTTAPSQLRLYIKDVCAVFSTSNVKYLWILRTESNL